jgi:hypothetical protein
MNCTHMLTDLVIELFERSRSAVREHTPILTLMFVLLKEHPNRHLTVVSCPPTKSTRTPTPSQFIGKVPDDGIYNFDEFLLTNSHNDR